MHRWLAVTSITIAAFYSPAAMAQNASFFTASYVEVGPVLTKVGALALRNYRDTARKEQSAAEIEVLQRIERSNQFVVLAAWADRAAYDAQAASENAKKLGEKLQTLLAAPIDARLNTGLSVAVPKPGKDAVIAVTHLDVLPSGKDGTAAALEQLADESRKHAGNLQFDVWQQTEHPNHFTIVESWSNQGAFDLHQMQRETREFRAKIAPMLGALFDERLYKALK